MFPARALADDVELVAELVLGDDARARLEVLEGRVRRELREVGQRQILEQLRLAEVADDLVDRRRRRVRDVLAWAAKG